MNTDKTTPTKSDHGHGLERWRLSTSIKCLAYSILMILSGAAAIAGDPPDMQAIDMRIDAYVDRCTVMLDSNMLTTLGRIPNRLRRMLAINHYLRRLHLAETRWTMSSEDVRQFKQTDDYREMLQQVAAVKRKFAELNPGYALTTSTEVRTLSYQINSWNRVRSVMVAANELLDTCRNFLTDSAVFNALDEDAFTQFMGLFACHETENLPTVAVPGFSMHGRMQAFDFKVIRGRRVIAPASSSAIDSRWDDPCWTQRLHEAVMLANTRLVGPLREPYEPWHYEYRR